MNSIILYISICIIWLILLIHKHFVNEKKRRKRDEAIDRVLHAPNLATVFLITHPNAPREENVILQITSPNVSHGNQENLHPTIDCVEQQEPSAINPLQLDLPPSYDFPPSYDDCSRGNK